MRVTRTYVRLETDRRIRRLGPQIGDEIRLMRLGGGLTLTSLSEVVGVHRSHLARIEAGTVIPSFAVLVAIGVALGADMNLRYFPGVGPRLVDRFQAAMVESFLRSLHRRWTVRLEVPILRPARGVIDAALLDTLTPIAIVSEAQSELRRLEQLIRWIEEKAAGFGDLLAHEAAPGPAPKVSRLLILRSTMATRALAREYRSTLATAFPARTVDVHAALTTSSAAWPGAGIVWMTVAAGTATLLAHPPRGVDLGR